MGPVPVVMIDEHFKGSLEVLLVQNQQPVETFGADGAHESLCDTVGLGRVYRKLVRVDGVEFADGAEYALWR